MEYGKPTAKKVSGFDLYMPAVTTEHGAKLLPYCSQYDTRKKANAKAKMVLKTLDKKVAVFMAIDQEAVRAMMQRIKLSQQAAGAMKAQGDTGAMTMKAVARGTGIEYTALSKFTSGKRDFAADRVQRIHDYIEGAA